MGIVKTLAIVGVSAGVGAWAGEKAHGALVKQAPASTPEALKGGTGRVAIQATLAIATFGVLRSIF